MATLTVRRLPDEVHRALRQQATDNGTNAEALARRILTDAVLPPGRLRLGDVLFQAGRQAGLTDDDVDLIESTFDRTPAEPPDIS